MGPSAVFGTIWNEKHIGINAFRWILRPRLHFLRGALRIQANFGFGALPAVDESGLNPLISAIQVG
jgi:hypothetical protein